MWLVLRKKDDSFRFSCCSIGLFQAQHIICVVLFVIVSVCVLTNILNLILNLCSKFCTSMSAHSIVSSSKHFTVDIIRKIAAVLLDRTVTSTWPHLNSDVGLGEGEY